MASSNAAAAQPFLDAVKGRRTYYALNKDVTISDKEIQEIANNLVLHVPSSFNSQSTRLVVLLNKEHDTFWDFTLEVLKTIVPEDQFASTQGRINGFKAAYGTVSCCFSSASLVFRVGRRSGCCCPATPHSGLCRTCPSVSPTTTYYPSNINK